MPKPIVGDNGSGMHVHQSIWKDGKNLFAGNGYAGLSETALYYIGGIIKHAKALNAITNPVTNSYKRLASHYEAPGEAGLLRQEPFRFHPYPVRGTSTRLVVSRARFPDPLVPTRYLCFAALMMAGLDGIQNKIHPGDPG